MRALQRGASPRVGVFFSLDGPTANAAAVCQTKMRPRRAVGCVPAPSRHAKLAWTVTRSRRAEDWGQAASACAAVAALHQSGCGGASAGSGRERMLSRRASPLFPPTHAPGSRSGWCTRSSCPARTGTAAQFWAWPPRARRPRQTRRARPKLGGSAYFFCGGKDRSCKTGVALVVSLAQRPVREREGRGWE